MAGKAEGSYEECDAFSIDIGHSPACSQLFGLRPSEGGVERPLFSWRSMDTMMGKLFVGLGLLLVRSVSAASLLEAQVSSDFTLRWRVRVMFQSMETPNA